MCEAKRRTKGKFVVSKIGTGKDCTFEIGHDAHHKVTVLNETLSECVVSVDVSCIGPHVETADGKTWSDHERSLDPGETGTFRGELFFRDHSGGRVMPADEEVVITLSRRRETQGEMKAFAELRHKIVVGKSE